MFIGFINERRMQDKHVQTQETHKHVLFQGEV